MKKKVFIILLLFSSLGWSQEMEMSGINVRGFASTNEALPFWMQSNQRGRVSRFTNFSTWGNSQLGLASNENFEFNTGFGLLYQDEKDKLQLDEIYIQYRQKWITATVGRKQKEELYNGLSSSNQNILWSINAQPLPGLQISSTKPILVFPKIGLGLEFSFEEYLLEEDRHVKNARLHHKRFHLVYQHKSHFRFKAGLWHFAQWGGTSATLGKQPNSFNDYLRIFAGQPGSDDAYEGDQLNALGNNLGSYELELAIFLKKYYIEIFYEHLFEDGSGRRLGNTPDGRYGLFIEFLESPIWFKSLIYEFYYTKHQSSTTTGEHKFDNYFNNGVYQSGWTYEGQTLGSPFFLTAPGEKGIVNNKMMVHHLGFGGHFLNNLQYRILGSYRLNYGKQTANQLPGQKKEKVFSGFAEFNQSTPYLNFQLQLGADFSSSFQPNYGIGIGLSKRF